MNNLAKKMRAIKRIAKDAILRDLCPKSMGVRVKQNTRKECHKLIRSSCETWFVAVQPMALRGVFCE